MRLPTADDRKALSTYILTLPLDSKPAPWIESLPGSGPIEIEAGFGKGTFLIEAASSTPSTRFLGIERRSALVVFTARRLFKRSLPNVMLLHDDARRVLHEHVPNGTISAIHLYFPDPWWKRKHRKRRIYTPEFFRCCEDALVPRGSLFIASDVAMVFAEIVAAIEAGTGLRQAPLEDSEGGRGRPATNFEIKAQRRGASVARIRYKKA